MSGRSEKKSVGGPMAEASGEGCPEQGGVVGDHRGGVAEARVRRRTGVGGMTGAPEQPAA